MKAEEIVYGIREKLKEYVDDTRYTNDYIMYLVRLRRALLIRREYSNLQRIVDQEILQSICMPLEIVDPKDCPDYDSYFHNSCIMMRTVDKLPFTIELHNKNMIYDISIHSCGNPTPSLKNKLNLISSDRAPYAGYGDYEKNKIFIFRMPDSKLYLKSNNGLSNTIKNIVVTAALDNPDDAAKFFIDCDESKRSCFNIIEDRYPIKAWMEDVIMKDIVEELANLKQLPADEINNSKADIN